MHMEPGEHSGPVQECCVHRGKDKVKISPYLNAQETSDIPETPPVKSLMADLKKYVTESSGR